MQLILVFPIKFKQNELFNRTKKLARSIRSADLNTTINNFLIEMMLNHSKQASNQQFKFKPSNSLMQAFNNMFNNSTKNSRHEGSETYSEASNDHLTVREY
jgi:hypothetical protein